MCSSCLSRSLSWTGSQSSYNKRHGRARREIALWKLHARDIAWCHGSKSVYMEGMCEDSFSSSHNFRRHLPIFWQLLHFVTMNVHFDVMHDTPAWLLLTPEASRFVREHEYVYPRPVHKIWRCNHCSAHISMPVTQETGVLHVKTE